MTIPRGLPKYKVAKCGRDHTFSPPMPTTALCLLATVIALLLFFALRQRSQPSSFPPGPPKYPLIGNALGDLE